MIDLNILVKKQFFTELYESYVIIQHIYSDSLLRLKRVIVLFTLCSLDWSSVASRRAVCCVAVASPCISEYLAPRSLRSHSGISLTININIFASFRCPLAK